MLKRISGFLLSLCILLSLAPTVQAKQKEKVEPQKIQYTVTNLESFLDLAEKCRMDTYSQNLQVNLITDLDLTNSGFAGFPIFCGTFEGNGHTIKGLSLTKEGSQQGLFRYLTETAVVEDLNLIGTVQPGGSRSEVGGFAGSNAGTIRNCSFTGNVSGSEYIGGIAGINKVSGIVENCNVTGKVSGNHFVGGIVGKNSGVIRNCENNSCINDSATENKVELSDITLNSLTTSESVNTVTDIGGISGSSMGVIRSCINYGNVGYQHMGYNIGGIAGTQSGVLLDCENNGHIQGRKEVGGIVGQMEPTALVEYEEDALQILQRQLSGMGSVVSQTVSNVQGTGDALLGHVGALQNHVTNARDAVDSLIPDLEDPSLPDLDTIQAAQNTIGSSISGMAQTLQGMRATTEGAMGKLSTNLHALQDQMNAMRTTLGNVSQTLGGSIRDVSDLDTEEDLNGKVAGCINYGSILADRNAGGIAGAIALENDLDHEDDWKILGENSLNFESELRAVILNCENRGDITCKKQNGGGIVGWQSLGLVKYSWNTGDLKAEGADYAGGISGQSRGYIRASGAKCQLSGSNFTGGIAGSATVVTDCCSAVQFLTGTENRGGILGVAETPIWEEEAPLSGNRYLPMIQDLGGIDGISYGTMAEPMTLEEFLAREDLPDLFKTVTVTFRYGEKTERTYTVSLGDPFPEAWIPPIHPRSGYVGSWNGLEKADLENVLFDLTFDLHYDPMNQVLMSQVTENDQPVLLVQGLFAENARLTVEPCSPELPLKAREVVASAWSFQVSQAESLDKIRIRIPQEAQSRSLTLYLQGTDGNWRKCDFIADGSYLAIALEEGDQAVALVQKHQDRIPLWIAGSCGAVMILGLLIHTLRKRKKKT